jgi:hypothetical protein
VGHDYRSGADTKWPGRGLHLQGYFTARIGFHQTESGDHSITLLIMGPDGAEIAKADGEARVQRTPGLPPQWLQNIQIVIPPAGSVCLAPASTSVIYSLMGSTRTRFSFG